MKKPKDRNLQKITNLKNTVKLYEKACAAQQERIDYLVAEIASLQKRLDDTIDAGNRMAVASGRLIADSEKLERSRNGCAELARIFGLTTAQLLKFVIPIIDADKGPEPKHERES